MTAGGATRRPSFVLFLFVVFSASFFPANNTFYLVSNSLCLPSIIVVTPGASNKKLKEAEFHCKNRGSKTPKSPSENNVSLTQHK